MFANSDDSVSANAVQAIQLGIQIIEDTVSSITGVYPQPVYRTEQTSTIVINNFCFLMYGILFSLSSTSSVTP